MNSDAAIGGDCGKQNSEGAKPAGFQHAHKCPVCGGQRHWKHGLRRNRAGEFQKFLCLYRGHFSSKRLN